VSVWNPAVVVVGVDGSEPAARAARAAAGLCRTTGARLLVVTVVRPPEGWWGVVGSPPPAEALGDALAGAQRDVLDATVDDLDLEGVAHRTVEEIGDPAARLVAVCEREEADVLVVGRQGAGLLRRILLGSVANRVAHEAPCPVLLIP